MKRTILKTIVIVLAILLVAEIAFVAFVVMRDRDAMLVLPPEAATDPELVLPETTLPIQTDLTTGPATEALTQAPTQPEDTGEPETEPGTEPTTEPVTEAPTEPEQNRFVLTFVGDCTLGSAPNQYDVMYSFLWFVKDDYGYPFRNVKQYFEKDDLTFVNLEGTFYDSSSNSSGAYFTFRGPTKYVNILTEGSVEVASLANNHTMDYREQGYESTLETLKNAGIAYVEKDKTTLLTTESGLRVGIYAGYFQVDREHMAEQIQSLRDQGAEVIVASLHWGVEGAYRPNQEQKDLAHAAIDAGADIVYGHHPHVLQPVEEYNGGIIYYSLANFCFGGNHWPQDLDSAILQQEIIREEDGTITLGELTRIPVSCSSLPAQNNFQPTPYEEGSEKYNRALSKLDGTFRGSNLTVNYN